MNAALSGVNNVELKTNNEDSTFAEMDIRGKSTLMSTEIMTLFLKLA